MPLLKICGLRRPDQAGAIAALGVDAIGVIAVPSSPRFVRAADRPGLFAAVRAANPSCQGVLVVADPDPDQLGHLAASGGHQVVQLHGEESPERCRQLREALQGVRLWKALRIRTTDDLGRVSAYQDSVDAVLLDAWVGGQLGGTGVSIPLPVLQTFAPGLPWWLAGGMTPARATEALAQLAPTGIDASSGVEHSPGDKDLDRVRALLAVIRTPRQDQDHIDSSVAPPCP